MKQLKELYENGESVEEVNNEVVKWLRKAADQGDADAQLYLGLMYEKGKGVKEDKKEVVKWWRKAADQGDADAQFYLGLMYKFGKGVKEDKKEVVKWWRKAANQGHADAQFYLGGMYKFGKGVKEDNKEAVKWWRKAANQGHAEAQFYLGRMYANGEGVEEDNKEAVKWYRKAANQGHADAQFNLGLIYKFDKGVEEDNKEVVKWWRKAADQGDAKAQFNLGLMYDNSEGVKEDKKEAVKWYRKAADQGDVRAQSNLGLMYEKGKGVKEDKKEAVKWYRKAADQGHAEAQSNLGVMYAKGEGVEEDIKEAMKWWRKADGHAMAQFLGLIMPMAKVWKRIKRKITNGFCWRSPKKGIIRLEQKLTDSQRVEMIKCIDIDGNSYKTVRIGNQVWMAENLKVTHYRDGTEIPTGHNNFEWRNLSTGAYAVYNDDESNADTYGYLYNEYAVDDSRNIAPEGWHVPTDDEIKQLEMHLGVSQSEADDTDYRGTNEGSKLAGNADLWNDGDLENNAEFGTSGFTAIPGGYRNGFYGDCDGMGNAGYFWSSTESSSSYAWSRLLYYNYSEVSRTSFNKQDGFSVRCLRD